MEPEDRSSSETPDMVSLGVFSGGALIFVRELLHDQAIGHRERAMVAPDGEPRSEIWVSEREQERAIGLLAQSQVEAEAAAHREALHAGTAATADAVGAQAATAGRSIQASRDPEPAQARPRPSRRDRRAARAKEPPADGATVLRRIVGAFAALLLVLTVIAILGDQYGTRRPVAGHSGKIITCRKWQVICF